MFLMYDLNMTKIEFPEGFIPLDIFISSTGKERTTDKVESSNRRINYGSTFNEPDITLNFLLRSKDTQDYRLLRDETYALFNRYDTFYLVEKYQRGKRYLVSVDEKHIPDRIPNSFTFAESTVTCTMPELPFAESVYTTDYIDKNGIPSGWRGMGLDNMDVPSYKFPVYGEGAVTERFLLPFFSTKNSTSEGYFRIYNAGNVPIHPFEQELKISVYDAEGSTDYLEIVNHTNDSSFRLNEGLGNKKLVIDGPNITLNNTQALRKTNRKYIELNPGWNEFTLKGAHIVTIEFIFRYYY